MYYKDILSYQYTFHRMYTSTLCTHIIHLQQIGCATDSCAKVQQIMHMQCCGCAFVWCPVITDVLVQCVRVVQ